MERGSTWLLRGVVFIIGLSALALCLIVLPIGLRSDNIGLYRPIIVGMYVAAIPFFLALYQAMQLLSYIDENRAFSDSSVKALKNIKYCAVTISALFAAGMPYIYFIADLDDAPGVVATGLVIVSASVVIATFAALLQRLLKNAIEIKSENDLTV